MITHLETEHGDVVFAGSMQVRFALVHPNAKLPTYATDGSVGLDLYAAHDAAVEPGVACAIDTGIAVEIPEGYFGAVCQRSGLARKGIVCTYGVIDSDYRGSIGVTLICTTPWRMLGDERSIQWSGTYHVKAGDRVAQLVVLPAPRITLVQVESVEQLSKTARGESGFGSSGQ